MVIAFKISIKRKGHIMFLSLLIGVLAMRCSSPYKQVTVIQNDVIIKLPIGFDSIPIPENNQLSQARIDLGQKLFFDKALSLDSTVSCASCHEPKKYFTDGRKKSMGINSQEVDRNAPSLFNIAYHPRLLREGGVPTLEMQVLVPVQEHREFNFNIVELAQRLSKDSTYAMMAINAYNRKMSDFVITRALAAYQRTLFSGNSPFDRFYYQNKKNAISPSAKRGFKLFSSDRLKCSQCHSGFNFTNYKVLNNGLLPSYTDKGKFRLTEDSTDIGKFKVPSLRNVNMTGPFLHDGSISKLEEIVDLYAKGGYSHPNQSHLITGFEISSAEKEDLINFLKSLTDTSVFNHP